MRKFLIAAALALTLATPGCMKAELHQMNRAERTADVAYSHIVDGLVTAFREQSDGLRQMQQRELDRGVSDFVGGKTATTGPAAGQLVVSPADFTKFMVAYEARKAELQHTVDRANQVVGIAVNGSTQFRSIKALNQKSEDNAERTEASIQAYGEATMATIGPLIGVALSAF